MRPSSSLAAMLIVSAFGGSTASAQIRVTNIDQLRRELSPGDALTIVQATGESVRGRLLRLGDKDLDIRTEAGPATGAERRRLDVTIPLSTIQSLERPRDSTVNGALIGAGVGAGVSLAVFIHAVAVDRNEVDEWIGPYLLATGIFTAVGAGAGWAIDRAHSKPHIRFDAPSSKSTQIRIVPLLGRRTGVGVVLSFR